MKLTNQPTGHHYITPEGTVLSTKPDQGKADSLGRTARAMICYSGRLLLWAGTASYFRNDVCYRYPDSDEINSRDHAVIAYSCLKQIDMLPKYNPVPLTSPRFTLGQRIWLKAMFSKSWSIIYLLYKLPGLAVIYPAWNWFWRAISGTLKTYERPGYDYIKLIMYDKHCNSYVKWIKQVPTKWQKFCFKLTLKAYASFYTLYEINALESEWAKRILRKVMILHFEKSNYVARAMCGQKVSYPYGYMPSRSNRWSVRLDRTCDRSMQPYNDTEEDNLEVAMLKHYCK